MRYRNLLTALLAAVLTFSLLAAFMPGQSHRKYGWRQHHCEEQYNDVRPGPGDEPRKN